VFRNLFHFFQALTAKKDSNSAALYQLLGFYPNNPTLYKQAFLHKSSSVKTDDGRLLNNERLEYLGDAILGAVIADILYRQFPRKGEGYLTDTRSKIVQRENLNHIALQLGLHLMVIHTGRLSSHNISVYGNVLEALIGAIYLDQGYPTTRHFIENNLIQRFINLNKIARKEVNFKSSLIEWSQKNKQQLDFQLINASTDNKGNPIFQTQISLADKPLATGTGYSKKESQQNAAKLALQRIRNNKNLQQPPHIPSNNNPIIPAAK